MAYSDEINSCTPPAGAPTGPRTKGRVQNFCDAINAEATLDVVGAGTFQSTLDVTGPSTFTVITATTGNFAALTLGGALLPPPTAAGAPPARGRAAGATASASSADGDLLVKNLVHAGGELRIGEGYYVSFKKSTSLTTSTSYVLPPAYPTTNGQVLSALTDGSMEWISGGGGFVDPTTTQGDLLIRGATVVERLGIGNPGQILQVASSGTELEYIDQSPGFTDPMTTAADIIVRNQSNTTTRLGAGNPGEVLTVHSSGNKLEWAPAGGGAGTVTSVNGATGVVVLDSDDISEGTTNLYLTTSERTSIASATQPGDNVSTLTNDSGYITSAQAPVQSVNGDVGTVVLTASDVGAATTAQGALADSATQPGDNVSTLTNDAGYITSASVPVDSVNGQTGTVVLDADDISDATTVNKFVDSAQIGLIASATQPGDNISTLTNDSGYITAAQVPADAVSSVNSQTGAVVLDTDDISDSGATNKYVTSAEKTSIGTATQPGDNVSSLTNDANYITLAQVPADAVSSVNSQTGAVVLGASDVGAATTAQGSKADSATQPGDNISTLTNDSGYITAAQVPADAVSSVNTQTGAVVLDADDIDDSATTHKFATASQLSKADSATQPGDNVSTLTNDANYITSAGAPVQSVAGKTGTVTLVKGDVGLGNVDNTTDLNKPISTSTQTALDAKADLVGGKVPTSQLPALAITEYLGAVASQSSMLALSGERGDWCIRTDLGSTFVLVADGGSSLSDWQELATPASPVQSVNGQTGTVVLGASDVGAATTAQGTLADSATQPGDNVSTLTNDAGYITSASVPVDSVNGQTGVVVLDADDISDSATTNKFATQAELNSIASATQPGDNISTLTNDSGYITAAQVPADAVSSVNTQTGAVVLGASDVGAATTAQGAKADSATQPGDNISTLTNDSGYITAAQVPADAVSSVNSQTGAVVLDTDDVSDTGATNKYVTAAEKTSIGTATQPGDNVSDLTNDANYITLAQVPADAVSSVNTQTGAVVLDADDIDDTSTTHKFATAAQLSKADSATQPGDNVSTLTNDANYITSAAAPVQSVNGATGTVVLDTDDVSDTGATNKYVTAAEKTSIGTATQPGDNVSTLTNDANYITSAQAPVQQLVAGNNVTLSPTTGIGTVTINAAGGGGSSVSIGPSPPASPSAGDLWWNDEIGRMFVYYVDANSSQWVDASPAAFPDVLDDGTY